MISVIIPVFNMWDLTRKCLRSLAATAPPDDLEVLVVDNASTDHTERFCQKLGTSLFGGRFRLLRQEKNMNFAPACNIGARHAQGGILFFLNNDTILTENWLPPLLRRLQTDASIGGVGPLLLYPGIGKYPDRVQHLGITVTPKLNVRHLYEGFPAGHPVVRRRRFFQAVTGAAFMTPHAVFDELGGFDEEFINGFEDVELCIRGGQKGYRFTCEPESVVYHLASQTPGRNDHLEHNLRLFGEKIAPHIYPDQHSFAEQDGFVTGFSPWLRFEARLPGKHESALDKILERNLPDLDAIEKLVENNPLWIRGHLWLAEKKLEQGKAEDALSLMRILTKSSRDLEHSFRLMRYAKICKDDKAFEAEFLFLVRSINPFERYLSYANELKKWLLGMGLQKFAGKIDLWLTTSDHFYKTHYIELLRKLQEIGFFSHSAYGRSYLGWVELREKPDIEEYKKQYVPSGAFPSISVLMTVYDPEPKYLEAALESVLDQIYPHWELCIADDASTNPQVHDLLRAYSEKDKRIRVVFREKNEHISAASNTALEYARYPWIALMGHDDTLADTALARVADAFAAHPDALLFYSDEDKIDGSGSRIEPYFKGSFDPDLLLCQNFVNHLGVYRTERMRSIGGFRQGFEGSQDYDLVLRYSAGMRNEAAVHIPHVLYHWRMHAGSTSAAVLSKPYAVQARRMAIAEHIRHAGRRCLLEDAENPKWHTVRWVEENMRASCLIVLLCGNDRHPAALGNGRHPAALIDALRSEGAGMELEIAVLPLASPEAAPAAEARGREKNGLDAVTTERWPSLCNLAVSASNAEIIGFLDGRLLPARDKWLSQVVAECRHEEIGAVGGAILDGDILLSAGYAPDENGCLFPFCSGTRKRYFAATLFGQLVLTRRVQAVGIENMFCRRAVWQKLGGLDPASGEWADADFCLRAARYGHSSLYTPYMRFAYAQGSGARHPRPLTDKDSRVDGELFRQRWGSELKDSGFRNMNCKKSAKNAWTLLC
jgi:GT2 family glycosyltransferase